MSAAWQSGLSNGANCGELIGLLLNGWISERFGYRYTVIGCLVLVTGFIAIFVTAQNTATLLVGEILCGIPWGVFQTLTITYASEVCPVALRGHLTTYVNACWGIGQLIGIGVIMGMLDRTDQWAYRLPYALQWMWPVPLMIGIFFAPESPWWLVRRGRIDDAKRALLRLTTKQSIAESSSDSDSDKAFDPDATIAMMVHTTALEADTTKGATYLACFRGHNLRRTEIVCMVWAIQNLSGNSFSNRFVFRDSTKAVFPHTTQVLSWLRAAWCSRDAAQSPTRRTASNQDTFSSTYFLEQAGLDQRKAYGFALGQYAFNIVGVVGAWFLMSRKIGRRTLYLYGLCGLFSMLLIMGFLGLVPSSHRNQGSIATGSIMLCWALVYQLTVGTVCYSLVAEISTRRLQIKTVVLGRAL